MHVNAIELRGTGTPEVVQHQYPGVDKLVIEGLKLRVTLQATREETRIARRWQRTDPAHLLEDVPGTWEVESPNFYEPVVLILDYDPMVGDTPVKLVKETVAQLLINLSDVPRGH